jgi:predicted dehydrogenase
MKRLGIGLVGSGFMGRSHTFAFRAAPGIFDLNLVPELTLLADADDTLAAAAAKALGYARSTGDWRTLVADPAVDLVDISAPNSLHKPVALAAIAAGKPVYSEKPLAPNAADAKEMMEAAEKAGIQTFVGFSYLKNPIIALAKDIANSGEIGEIVSFRGVHAEDYMSNPDAPWTWRLDPAGGHGVVADLGSHIISIARALVGPVDSLVGQIATTVKERPVAPGAKEKRPVEVDDEARCLVNFASGATGSIQASWVATGRKMTIAFELTGTKGSVFGDFEHQSELQVFTGGQAKGREGFKTIMIGPDHEHYRALCPAPGHQIGFNDLKTLEVRAILSALSGGPKFMPDFREAWEIQRVVDAIVLSHRQRSWLNIRDI